VKGVRAMRLTLRQRNTMMFYVFTFPFLVGFILFFLYPMLQTAVFSLNELKLVKSGYELKPVGLANYNYALFVDPQFLRTFVGTVAKMLSDVPLILGFSFFAAVLLNQKFRGREVARLVFFLPVVMGAGIVARMEQGDYMKQILQLSLEGTESVISGAALRGFLLHLRLPQDILEYVLDAIDRVADIVASSGIQILVFLAGLQSVPSSLYEAAEVEGSTAWESFWMITFPMLSPLILTNTVYTVIDSFTKGDNALVVLINKTAFTGVGYGVGTAMSLLYFLAVALILSVFYLVISKFVIYHD